MAPLSGRYLQHRTGLGRPRSGGEGRGFPFSWQISPVHLAKKNHYLWLGHGNVQPGQQPPQLLCVDAAIARHVEQPEQVAQLLLENKEKNKKSDNSCVCINFKLCVVCILCCCGFDAWDVRGSHQDPNSRYHQRRR